jgi:hypothetical protein
MLCFLQLRDSMHTAQAVVFSKESDIVAWAAALPRESVVDLFGELSVPNEPIKTCSQSGIELQVKRLFCVSRAKPELPLQLEDASRSDTELAADPELPRVNQVRHTTTPAIGRRPHSAAAARARQPPPHARTAAPRPARGRSIAPSRVHVECHLVPLTRARRRRVCAPGASLPGRAPEQPHPRPAYAVQPGHLQAAVGGLPALPRLPPFPGLRESPHTPLCRTPRSDLPCLPCRLRRCCSCSSARSRRRGGRRPEHAFSRPRALLAPS